MHGADDADELDAVAEGRVNDIDGDSSGFNTLMMLPLATNGNAGLQSHNMHKRSQPTRTIVLDFANP